MMDARSASRAPDRRDLLIAAMLLLFCVILYGPLLDWQLHTTDEGYLINALERMGAGQLLYRDFERNYPPASYYLYLPFHQLADGALWATRSVSLLLRGLLVFSVYLLARPHAPRLAAVLGALLAMALPPALDKTYVALVTVAGVALCAASADLGREKLRPFLIGTGLGAVALFRQDIGGAVALVAIGTAAIHQRADRRSYDGVGWMMAGTAWPWLATFLAFGVAGALPAMIEQVVLRAVQSNAGMSLPFPSPFRPSPQLAYTGAWEPVVRSLFFFPAIVSLAGLAVAAGRRNARSYPPLDQPLVSASLVVLLSYGSIMQRSDMEHLTQVFAVVAPVVAILLGCAWDGRRRRSVAVAAALLTAWTAIGCAWGGGANILVQYRDKRSGNEVSTIRGRFFAPPQKAIALQSLLRSIDEYTAPGEPIFVIGYAPMLYYLSQRPNPTPYDTILPGYMSSEKRQTDVIEALSGPEVRMVIVSDKAWDGRAERGPLHYAQRLMRFLEAEFAAPDRIDDWLIFLRSQPEPTHLR